MKKTKIASILALCTVFCVVILSLVAAPLEAQENKKASKPKTSKTKTTKSKDSENPLDGQILSGTWKWEPQTPADKTDGDTSICRLVAADEVIGGETVRVYNLSGTVTKVNKYGVGECFITPDAETLELLKTAKSVSFKVQGDGKKYQFEAPISTVTDWGFHVYNFEATAEPVEYTIQMRMFMQPSWAEIVKFNQTRITKFNFKTRNATEGGVGDFSLKMWDLKLHM